jgi:hypothetical protein
LNVSGIEIDTNEEHDSNDNNILNTIPETVEITTSPKTLLTKM